MASRKAEPKDNYKDGSVKSFLKFICLTHLEMLCGLLGHLSFRKPALSTHSLFSSQGHGT